MFDKLSADGAKNGADAAPTSAAPSAKPVAAPAPLQPDATDMEEDDDDDIGEPLSAPQAFEPSRVEVS